MRTVKGVPALFLGALLVCGMQSAWGQDSQSNQPKQDAKKGDHTANAAARNGSHPKPNNAVLVAKGASNSNKQKTHQAPQSGSTTQPQ